MSDSRDDNFAHVPTDDAAEESQQPYEVFHMPDADPPDTNQDPQVENPTPAWAGPLAGAVAGALGGAVGGALGITLAAPATVLGGMAVTVVAGGALVSRLRNQEVSSASAAENPAVVAENVDNLQSAQEPSALGCADPNPQRLLESGEAAEQEAQSQASEPSPQSQPIHQNHQSYADGLLGERSLMERLRLLQRLHEKRDEAALGQLCVNEGFSWVGASSSTGCFVRRVGEQTEVFFLGSEADFQSRPEAFMNCWLHTNAQIQLQRLDASICPESTAPREHVHTGFQTSYLSIASELLEVLQESAGPVCMIGYSLGGALATLAALHLCSSGFTQIDLITFGSPRVGNEAFRDYFTERCVRPNHVRVARYVNTLDVVPHVPFNPEDVESTRQGQLWRRVEEALTIPQQQLSGSSPSIHGSYVHVVPGIVLDGLSTSVAGVVSRLANMAAEYERLRMAAAVPLELVAEHDLSKYVTTLQEASRPAWLCLSNRLLAVTSPVHNALRELQVRREPMAPASSWGIAMASGAAEATGSGIVAGLLLPQLLSSAVSAVGCYCVAQKVNQVSQHLQDHTMETARSNEELQLELQQLKLELSNAHGSVVTSLQDLAQYLRRRSCEDLLRRGRVAQRHLREEVEVFLMNPTAGHAQMVREACGELRKAAAEVLEMIHDSRDADAEELAQCWQVVLSAYRLVLWATTLADGDNAALRAAQALQNIAAPLGEFFWQHLATGEEPWLPALERQRVHFLSIASMAMTSAEKDPFNENQTSSQRLFTCLGLDPGNPEIRLSLACHFTAPTAGPPWASQRWLEGFQGGKDRMPCSMDDDFLQGLLQLLQGNSDLAAERWEHLASRRDVVASLRALELPDDLWCALAQRLVPPSQQWPNLTLAVAAAQCLPAPMQRQLDALMEGGATAAEQGEKEVKS